MNRFLIDGYDILEAYNIKVLSADGLDIIPKIKKRDSKSWPEESGSDVDIDTEIVYEDQEITLNCYSEENTYSDCIKRINGLINKLSGNGYHLLGSEVRNRLYPVVLQEISTYQRRTSTNANKVAITFSIKLLNPLPECRMGSATVLAAGEVSFNAETNKQVTVWWGDGSSSKGIGLLNHTYTNAGTYTLLIAGTGVTSSIFTVTGITIDEYSYPAEGDVVNYTAMPTSGMAYSKAEEAISLAEAAQSTAAGKENSGVASSLVNALKDSVPEAGDTLKKLYNLVLSRFAEVTVNNTTARNAYDVTNLPLQIYVLDDGDGKWALYKCISTGINRGNDVKISDPDLLNAQMSASAIKAAYESNADTNAFTNALLARLNALSQSSAPEFANTFNTALNTTAETGGEVTPTLWAWIQSVYASITAKSVKSFLIGAYTILKDHATRLEVLESDYILKYVVPQDVSSINLTTDRYGNVFNFVEGDKILIVLQIASNVTTDPRLRLNNITSDVYKYGAFTFTSFGLATIARRTFGGVIELTIMNSEVYGFCSIINETDTTRNSNTQSLKTIGLNAQSISSIQIFQSANLILANSIILIKKL